MWGGQMIWLKQMPKLTKAAPINRLLIIGLGSIGRRHLAFARKLLPEATIAVLRHKTGSDIPEYADYIFYTMAEALAFAPQVAVIANPATFHISSAMPLADAGIHTLIEKPISTTTDGVVELLNSFNRTNTVLTIGYNLRFLSSLQKFKSMLDEKKIGEIWSVHSEIGQYLPNWRPDSDYRQSVSARYALGGGVLLELSHELDYLRWIFGEVKWVQAVLARQSDLEVDVEDSAYLTLGFAARNSARSLIATANLDFIRQDTTRSCTAVGKLGSLRWNGIEGTVEFWAPDQQGWQEVYKHQSTRDESYVAQWQHFIDCVERETKPLITGTDGLKVLQIVEAVRLAAKTGNQTQVVNVNAPGD